MKGNQEQYNIEVSEQRGCGPTQILTQRKLDDPFIRTVIRPRGWRAAWAVLFGRYEARVRVDGEAAAFRVVFRGDYTPPAFGGVDTQSGKGDTPALPSSGHEQ